MKRIKKKLFQAMPIRVGFLCDFENIYVALSSCSSSSSTGPKFLMQIIAYTHTTHVLSFHRPSPLWTSLTTTGYYLLGLGSCFDAAVCILFPHNHPYWNPVGGGGGARFPGLTLIDNTRVSTVTTFKWIFLGQLYGNLHWQSTLVFIVKTWK